MCFAARGRLLVVTCASAIAFAGLAAAQPAPITFAGRAAPTPATQPATFQTASADTSLVGGGEGSYGYGAQARPRGAVIDLRRPASGARPAAADGFPDMQADEEEGAETHAAPHAPTAGQGAAPWLEAERVAPPYEANGRWYVPTPEPGYEQTGQAVVNPSLAAPQMLTASHPTLPAPSLVQVTNLDTGREAIVRVIETAPAANDGIIGLSHGAADLLGVQGQARVHVRYLGPAPRQVAAAETLRQAAPVVAGPVSLQPAAAHAPVRAAAAEGAFMVQIGAFSDLSNAHRVQAAVETAGPVIVDTRTTARGDLFRVRVGPFASREEAELARRQAATLGYGEAIIASR